MRSNPFHFECNESRSKKQPSDDENCFVAVCERLNINPYKDRYFKDEISAITGYPTTSIDNWSQNKANSPFPLYKDAHRRTFIFRNDLIEFLSKIEQVGINCKEMA